MELFILYYYFCIMTNIEKTYNHEKLGLITVVWKNNIRNVRMSFKRERLTITAPVGYSLESIIRLINENEKKLFSFIKRHESRREDISIDENFTLDTHFAILHIALTNVSISKLKKVKSGDKDELLLEMPLNTDFTSPETRTIIKEASIAMLRYEAKNRLPLIVKEVADANGFKYSGIKINSAQTRWGSCSSKGSLNFSLFLMLMPLHLIRSVVVHELCHTEYMNHGPNFWALFDKVYGVSHLKVDKEIRELKLPTLLRE